MFNRGYGGMGFDDLEKTLVGYGIAIGLAVIATIVLVILLYVMILPKSKKASSTNSSSGFTIIST